MKRSPQIIVEAYPRLAKLAIIKVPVRLYNRLPDTIVNKKRIAKGLSVFPLDDMIPVSTVISKINCRKIIPLNRNPEIICFLKSKRTNKDKVVAPYKKKTR